VVLAVQRPPVARQLPHIIVDRVDKLTRRYAGLGVEDQVVPDASQFLKICGDRLGVRFLAPRPSRRLGFQP
jgi:hypothetical protein